MFTIWGFSPVQRNKKGILILMTRMKISWSGLFIVLCWLAAGACKNSNSKTGANDYDTPQKGTIHISVDETFKPVITEQIKVYESSYPNTHIIADYKPEADCFRDLNQDSTRMVIVAKPLTADQKKA